MGEQIIDKTKEVAEYWGDKMPMMAMEECGELIQAISKFERKDRKVFEPIEAEAYTDQARNLIIEMGDVLISIAALINLYGIPADDVNDYIDDKLRQSK